MDELKKQAEELGIKVDKRWSEETLQEKIDEKLAADPEPEVVAEVHEGLGETAPEAGDQDEPEPAPEPELSAEEQAAADAEIEAEIQARFDASQDNGVVIVNLQANPMKSLGLTSYGEATITELQMADPRFAKKVERAIQLGLVKVK